MNNNLDGQIKIVPMVVGHASTTAPVFGTSDTNVSKAVEIPPFMEVIFVMTIKEITVTTTPTFGLSFQECATEGGTYTDILADGSTQVARFFENEVVPGTLSLTGPQPKKSYYGTMKASPRLKFIKAVPANGSVAISYNVTAILHEPRQDTQAQASQMRVAQSADGITVA